ncbi:hypothetical protein [Natrialba sp. PRR66]|uniref:hypothetical protein n=1 Tax=Natrialba sp. PRR66 TaxID=3098146 RepID=UPI0034E0A3C0
MSVDPKSSELLYIRLFSTTTTALTEIFFSELVERHNVSDTVFLVDESTPSSDGTPSVWTPISI